MDKHRISGCKIGIELAATIKLALLVLWPQLEGLFPADLITYGSAPLPHLLVYTNGIQCTWSSTCGYICSTKKSMQEHWRTKRIEHQQSIAP